MFEQMMVKIVDKLVSMLTTPEDLIFTICLLGFGTVLIREWQKSLKKNEEPKKENVPLCPLTKLPAKCHDIPEVIVELKKISADNKDIQNRTSKLMNIVSKEFEGRWDRYLYDRDISPKDDDVRIDEE